jgi:hypothetical protein
LSPPPAGHHSFKARFVAPLCRARAAAADFGRPVFGAAAFFLAARAAGVRVPRAQLCSTAGVSSEEFGSTLAQMEALCADMFGDVDEDEEGGEGADGVAQGKAGARKKAARTDARPAAVPALAALRMVATTPAVRASPRKATQQQVQALQQQKAEEECTPGGASRNGGGTKARRTPGEAPVAAGATPASSARLTRAAAAGAVAGAGAGGSPTPRRSSASKRSRLSFDSGDAAPAAAKTPRATS